MTMIKVLGSGYGPVERRERSACDEFWAWRELWDQVLSGFAWLG